MYFSVRKPFRIAGKLYKPCICYELPENLRLTLNRLVADGSAIISEEQIFFQSGARLEAKAEPPRKKEEKVAERRKRQTKPKQKAEAPIEPIEPTEPTEPTKKSAPIDASAEDMEQAGF